MPKVSVEMLEHAVNVILYAELQFKWRLNPLSVMDDHHRPSRRWLKSSGYRICNHIITHTYVRTRASLVSNNMLCSWRAFCPFFTRPQSNRGVSFNESNAYMSQMVFNEIDSQKDEEEEEEEEEEKQEMAFITLNFTSNTFANISFLQRSI
uniref:Uncharacterized protein n=1 Tax=Glossina austeni TaxID=7395 RepID=A0A1A9V432_GLOAU